MTSAGMRAREFRDDIQALRGIAVLLVVLAHVLSWPSGGFIGVDVFFVISGFLITRHLIESRGTVGRSLYDFYRRRARRILPAAVLVITTTFLVAQLLFSEGRVARVANDSLWSLLFAANIHFGFQGADYFESDGPVSPLQHYWSLAVEEQFYLVWPLLLLGALAVVRRDSDRGRRAVTVAVAAPVVVASFAWSWYDTSSSPVGAYFSTPARAWELGAGALLAAAAGRLPALARPLREGLALLGLAGILLAAVVLGPDSPVPGPAAALPVLGAVAYIAGGARTTDRLRAHRLVGGHAMLRVGALSFSIYLWHWPVLVFVETLTDLTVLRVFFTLVTTWVLSELSHRFVERPFLAGGTGRLPSVRRWAVVGLAGATVLALAVPHVTLEREAAVAAEVSGMPTLEGDAGAMSATLNAQLEEAMATETFPALAPPLEDPYAGIHEAMTEHECLNPDDPVSEPTCTFPTGDPDGRLALVVGDSIATSWLPGIIKALGDGWTVRAVTFSSCPPAEADLELVTDETEAACRRGVATILRVLEQERPDLVIGSSHQGSLAAVQPSNGNPDGWSSYVAGLTSFGQKVRDTGAGYVLLGPAPAGPRALDCAGAFGRPSSCVTSPKGDFEGTISAFGAAAAAGGFGYVDTTWWFCGAFGCPIFAADRLIRWDNAHMTRQYVEYLAPLLRESLLVHVPDASR